MFKPTLILALLVLLHAAAPALAKDGDGGGGDNGGGGGGHGSDDHGGDDNGGDSGDNGGDRDEDDGSSARAGVSSGAILPLSAILASIEPEFDARLIDADIKQRRGRMIYELELITQNGRVLDLEVDAATARVLDIEVDD